MRTFTIEMHAPNTFTIREGERYVEGLTWDEMLGSVAELMHPKIDASRYPLLTEAGHRQREDELRLRVEQKRRENRQRLEDEVRSHYIPF